jgi:hypothetical protein
MQAGNDFVTRITAAIRLFTYGCRVRLQRCWFGAGQLEAVGRGRSDFHRTGRPHRAFQSRAQPHRTSVDQGRGRVAARWRTTSMIANRHSQAALLKSQIDQIDHRLKELEKSASSLRVAMVHLREQMEAALPPPPPPPQPLLVPKEGYMVRRNEPPKGTSPEAQRKREYMRNYMRGGRQRLLEQRRCMRPEVAQNALAVVTRRCPLSRRC